jgi:hypothetical protein
MGWEVPVVACRTTNRGYGAQHQALRKQWAQVVLGGGVQCRRCGRAIEPWMAWDLGHHDLDRSLPCSPEHRRCNRGTSGRRAGRRRVERVDPPARDW